MAEHRSWERHCVVRCHCTELSYTHVHCPCNACEGKAVSTSVEYVHWRREKELHNTTTCVIESESDTDPESSSSMQSDSENSNASGLRVEEPEPISSIESNVTEQPNENESNTIELEVICTILRAMNLAAQMHGSIKDFEDVINFARELFCREDPDLYKYWPKNWHETERLLKNNGYRDPKEYFICLDDSHYSTWDISSDPSSKCKHCGKQGSIKYYYLGLSDKVLLWCKNKKMCVKMMAHWENQDHWISGQGSHFPLKEIWDGERFNELAWFWDPNRTFVLPLKRHVCQCVISAEEIESSEKIGEHSYDVLCNECGFRQQHTPQYAHGEPRNIALIGHWDGWQPFGTPGRHSCGAVEVAIANMYKKERSSVEEIYVIGFIPTHCLPKKRPCSLDPFLDPFISEVEELFITGLVVDYAQEFHGLPDGEITIRCLLILWTGDYVAQCEVGKFIKGGIRACRRDKLEGIAVGSSSATGVQYYYGENRYHARYPFDRRTLAEDLEIMKEINEEDRKSIRAQMSRDTGYTGLSILHRLHKLYGFNVLTDTVFDMMHNIPINVVSKHLQMLVESDKVDKKSIDDRLRAVPWTAELKDGRIPEGFDTRLGFWKAEEFHKFAYPLSECILAGYLEGMDYHIWQLVARMVELVFSTSKREEWYFEDVELFHSIAQRYTVLSEETYGLSFCTITVHNLVHVKEDALRFSHPDNYWCFPFERAVKRYVNTSTNFKNIELTYAKMEKRRELLKLLTTTHPSLNRQHKYLQMDIEKMCANSLEAAHELVDVVCTSHTQDINRCYKGILVGGMCADACDLSRDQLTQVANNCNGLNFQDVHGIAYKFRSLFKPLSGHDGVLYRIGEHALVETNDNTELVVQFEAFYCIPVRSDYKTFFEATKYKTMEDDEGNAIIHQYSGYTFVIKLPDVSIFCPTTILRKVMLFPCFEQEDGADNFVAVDYLRRKMPIMQSGIVVPFYPEVNDMIFIRGEGDESMLANVLSVQHSCKTIKIWYYKKVDENDDDCTVYIPESNGRLARDCVLWDSVIRLSTGGWIGKHWDTMA